MRDIYRQHGKVLGLGPVAFDEPKKLHVLAVGPEFNSQVLSDPALFRPTGLLLRGPENSAQRRVRQGLTRMTDAELVGQIAILFVASFETTTSALTWALFLIAQHPKVALKC